MLTSNQIESSKSTCVNTAGIGRRFLLLALGGGIGAIVALLFARKRGEELRTDIVDAAAKGYAETLDTASRVQGRARQYCETGVEKGRAVLGAVAATVTAHKKEASDEPGRIDGDIYSAAGRAVSSRKSSHIF